MCGDTLFLSGGNPYKALKFQLLLKVSLIALGSVKANMWAWTGNYFTAVSGYNNLY